MVFVPTELAVVFDSLVKTADALRGALKIDKRGLRRIGPSQRWWGRGAYAVAV